MVFVIALQLTHPVVFISPDEREKTQYSLSNSHLGAGSTSQHKSTLNVKYESIPHKNIFNPNKILNLIFCRLGDLNLVLSECQTSNWLLIRFENINISRIVSQYNNKYQDIRSLSILDCHRNRQLQSSISIHKLCMAG